MVSQQINKMLTERASQFGLILDDISIVIILIFTFNALNIDYSNL
jgi:hypothetical protein